MYLLPKARALSASLLLTAVFSTSSFGGLFSSDLPFSEKEVAQEIVKQAKANDIDTRILFTLASTESDFKPLSIAIETSPARAEILKSLASKNIEVTAGKTFHSKIALVTLYPKDYPTAVFLITKLEELGFTYDVGLMQVNTCNFCLSETKKMLDPKSNIEKATKHFKVCQKEFSSIKLQVECYNRGAGNLRKMLKKGGNYFPYWKRYKEHWDRYFD